MKKLLLALPVLLLTACATVQPGNQTAEVNAERTLTVSLAAIDSFLRFEAAHRAELPPSVALVAAALRRDAPKALVSANTTRMAYKLNRGASGEANLLTALAVVESLTGQTRVWINPATVAAGGPARSHTRELEAEAKQKHLPREQEGRTPGSWAALVPLFSDLAVQIFKAVNESRAAAKQSEEWSPEADAAFAAKLTLTTSLPHWKL